MHFSFYLIYTIFQSCRTHLNCHILIFIVDHITVTNDDGRTGPVLKGEAFVAGTYEWTFFAGDYFAACGLPTAGTPFLNEVRKNIT